jgi:sugar/nucleoside kinase (ribokinase family)
MKFKNTNDEWGSRALRLTDKAGVTLEVMHVDDDNPFPVLISVKDHDKSEDIFGLSRPKALKLAWAIIDELALAHLKSKEIA